MEKVNVARFDEILKGDKPVVCDFYTTWCGPCKVLAPVLDELAEKYSDRAVFIKADIDLNIELAVRYGITSIPFVAVFKGGELVDNTLGYSSRQDVIEFLDKNI